MPSSPRPSTSTSTSTQDGWSHYLAGRLEETHAICERLIQTDQHHGPAWELVGLVFHDRGQFIQAADALERASLYIAVRSEARIALAAAYGALQRKDLSRELYLELMFRGELGPLLLLQVAAGLEAIDHPELAMEACRRAERQLKQQTDTDGDTVSCQIAQVHYDMGFYASRSGYPSHLSESLICSAIDLEPDNVHFRVGLVSMLIRLDRFEEAFDFAAKFSVEQIGDITCQCCLERIANLLSGFGDSVQAELCRIRLSILRESDENLSSTLGNGDSPTEVTL